MLRILVLGATGFIGKIIVQEFASLAQHEIITHSRQNSTYNSPDFTNTLQGVDVIINCSGIGLSKLYKTKDTNTAITQDICKAIISGNSNAAIFHLSTIKAYNPYCIADPYANDKAEAEGLFKKFGLLNRTCILRIPIVTGKNDPNFVPLIACSKVFPLPLVKSKLPKLNIISSRSLAHVISNLITNYHKQLGKILYVLNLSSITWNDLITTLRKPSFSLPLWSVRLLWQIASLANYFSRDRVPFPKERFNDLFVHEWPIEKVHNAIFVNDDIANLLSSIDEQKV